MGTRVLFWACVYLGIAMGSGKGNVSVVLFYSLDTCGLCNAR